MSQTLKTDAESGAAVTLDWLDSLVHDGRVFTSGSTVIMVAAAGITNFLLRIPAAVAGGVPTHFWYRIKTSGETHVDLYEDPTVTVDGNARPPINVNRNSAAVTAVTCFSESTIGVDGTYLDSHVVGSAGGKMGGSATARVSWHGLVGEEYLLVVETLAANLEISVTWRFFEEP